ncbi:phosphoribosylaminoimidazole carboxylase ATPase subunit [Ameyamaea chiangmaiensis NBRC 103196]|uniref:N5-carboxyaminoimidazole ribonucleotide synthase n=1 Tax=Ameyamaea chiangmaiensis TaxID=442969 RepID=A0A850P933_9PROT|nr:5-(carboxyamino)imidazole ribonucleotide synthase [Ameyamaea chiangmaiensis]MBS4073777.1 5-(carboxyamino)imidazole ribonucleotide synthase [Ameyamaea chiangmaiensis]NVN40504.1 5-(carboxyamino)imidazole ribonucleotide synthase [Ameyamaea chiangmaiensis]GBQ68490.1 phosphoribosylaminoimidazole carboxylase ATPase subunit [Ameyamaea chiangmaiensis NBRC 103196]
MSPLPRFASNALAPDARIGIVGGGQLGRMSAMAAARLGFQTHVLAASRSDPAVQVCNDATIGPFNDTETLKHFADHVDVVTFEFENISADGLDFLASQRPVRPAGAILRISQDRLAEKRFMADAGLPVAPWHAVTTRADLHTAAETLGYPFVLKTTRLGYDGKGQARPSSDAERDAAFDRLRPHPLVAEGLVDFAREISVMVARGVDGHVVTFDPTENRHRDGILDISIAPARIEASLAREARAMAVRIAERLDLVGLLGVEMFVTADGALLINEIAPRPHNSGHWTMNACLVDQFEMHVRAVAGLPLVDPGRHSDAVMRNLIGPADVALCGEIIATPGLALHLYGKTDARDGRKMGHVNLLFPRGAMPGEFGIQAALGPLRRDDAPSFQTEPEDAEAVA